jgi:hypothetical protein
LRSKRSELTRASECGWREKVQLYPHQLLGRYVERDTIVLLEGLKIEDDGPAPPARLDLAGLSPREKGYNRIPGRCRAQLPEISTTADAC